MLNDEQRTLVEKNLGLVGYVLNKYIKINSQRWEYDFEDLYQVGYEGLCIASAAYDPERGVSYWHYAEIVTRNHLYKYCQLANNEAAITAGGLSENLVCYDDELLIDQIILASLDLNQYTGTTRKGVEALKLKFLGFKGTEIGQLYHAPANHVSAWISRAVKVFQKESTM